MTERNPALLVEALALLDQSHRMTQMVRAGAYWKNDGCWALLGQAERLRARSQELARRYHGPIYRGRC